LLKRSTRLPSTSVSRPSVRFLGPHLHVLIQHHGRRHYRSPTAVVGYQPDIAGWSVRFPRSNLILTHSTEAKHRGFAFVTYSSAADAQDAIDNMDLNELHGRVIKVNLARPMKGLMQQPGGNRASACSHAFIRVNLTRVSSLGERGMAQSQCIAAIAKWRSVAHVHGGNIP
jgi:hypothetical protein